MTQLQSQAEKVHTPIYHERATRCYVCPLPEWQWGATERDRESERRE